MSKKLKLAGSGDRRCKRIMRGNAVVAMAVEMANGDWSVSDLSDRKISPRNFKTAGGRQKMGGRKQLIATGNTPARQSTERRKA